MSARSFSRWATGLALAGLAIILTGIFMWGVIGKHRLDEEAHSIYKATRAICSESRGLPCELPRPTEVPRIPPADAGALVLQSVPVPLAADVGLASPSRSPPHA